MAIISCSAQIKAPQARVFEAFTDLENAPSRIEGIQKLELLTPGPVGKGTRFRETRIMFKKEATEDMEFTQFNPPESYVVEAESHGSHYTSTFTFKPNGEGTEVAMTFEAKPLTFMAKIFSVMFFFMKGSLKKCLVDDMNDLKTHLEASA